MLKIFSLYMQITDVKTFVTIGSMLFSNVILLAQIIVYGDKEEKEKLKKKNR